MRIQVVDLLPNPFRNLSHYPLNREKIEALKKSIKDTSFWDNLLVRKSPNGNGGYELAYGHHRLSALTELKVDEIDVPVRELTNTKMAQIMAHENMEEWTHSASIEQETVRAIVEAYGKGEIELPKPNAKTSHNQIRLAPSFIQAHRYVTDASRCGVTHPYTIDILADFLGWKHYKVESALQALALIEKSIGSPEDFNGLSSKQAEAASMQSRRVLRETNDPEKAKAVLKGLTNGMRTSVGIPNKAGRVQQKQSVTVDTARYHADVFSGNQLQPTKKPKNMPEIDKFTKDLAFELRNSPTQMQKEKIQSIITNNKHLSDESRNSLLSAIRGAAQRWKVLAERLEVH